MGTSGTSETSALENRIFQIGEEGIQPLALEIFRFQYAHNPIYRAFTDSLGIRPEEVSKLTEIPFLPVSFFKGHPIRTTEFIPETIFRSSGTSGTGDSCHEVRSVDLYKKSFSAAFRQFYGPVSDYC